MSCLSPDKNVSAMQNQQSGIFLKKKIFPVQQEWQPEWKEGFAFSGALEQMDVVRQKAEEEFLFAATGNDRIMVAAILMRKDRLEITIKHLYAFLPEADIENIGRVVSENVALQYSDYQYCGFMTIRPPAHSKPRILQ